MSRSHRIADIEFGASESWLLCDCGTELTESDPEELAESFQAHRMANGSERRAVSDPAYATEDSVDWKRLMVNEKSRRYYARHRDAVCARQRDRHARKKAAA